MRDNRVRFHSTFLISLVLFIPCPGFGQTQSASAEPPAFEDFLGEADFWSPELSPSGQFLAGVRRIDKSIFLITVDLQADEAKPNALDLGKTYLNWVEWITDERLLMSLTVYVDALTGEKIGKDDWDDLHRRSRPVGFTRVMAMNRDGGNPANMFADDPLIARNLNLGRVVSYLEGDDDHILMAARERGDLDLFKLNVHDGSFERIAEGTDFTYRWYVDREGEPAFRFNTNRNGTVIYIHAREERKSGKMKWKKIKTIRLSRNRNDKSATEFSPLFPGPSETTYYVAARPEGKDKTGIHIYDFEQDRYIQTIKVDDEVDIENALFNRQTRELQGVYYYRDRLVIEFEDQITQNHLDGLSRYFGDGLNVLPLMSNREGDVWLLKTEGPSDSGSYHIYDFTKASARHLGSNFDRLAGKRFGKTEVVSYTARDGLELRGYLTRPADLSEGDTPPLIMMPHGGPESRDIVTFNFKVQMLVAEGYQVFQPNFRGSAGFGKSFTDLGRGEWGGAMQTDVEDAFHHLISEGLADRDAACIYGASYGGYVALMAATSTPELYRCAIAQAAPSDLLAMLKWDKKMEGGDSEAYQYWVEHIGDPKKDKERIRSVSPVNLADNVTRPLLIIHGAEDDIVPMEQADLMERALKKAGKSYQRITLEDSGHNVGSEEDERKEFIAIRSFLAENLSAGE